MESNDNIFTKEMYLQYLNSAYNNMYADKVLVRSYNYFIIKIFFCQNYFDRSVKEYTYKIIKIQIPRYFDRNQIINFILGTLTKSQLKKLVKILVKPYNCINNMIDNETIYIYNFKDVLYLDSIRNDMVLNYKEQNQDALNAIIKN